MSGVLRSLGSAPAAAAIGSAGCAGDDTAGNATDPRPTSAGGTAERIVIRTRVDLPEATILDGSTVGGSPFCPGGTAVDSHGTPDIGLVDRTITCEDGTLRMGFDPQAPTGGKQAGPWRIISGTGAYEGWAGEGVMVVRYAPSDTSEHPTRGRERYTGTVTR